MNSVAPGFIRTNAATEAQWDSYGPDGQQALVERIAMKRLGSAQDIANAVVFFASDLAGFRQWPGAAGGWRAVKCGIRRVPTLQNHDFSMLASYICAIIFLCRAVLDFG